MADGSTKEQVNEQGHELAQHASDEARRVAGTVKEQAAEVRHEAAAQGQQVVERAKVSALRQGDAQAQQAAQGLRRLGDQTRALAEGRVEAAGPLGDYARQASERLHGMANRVDQRGAQGILDDVQGFARQRPGVFLAGAALAGFLTGRLVRGMAAAQSDATVPSDGTLSPQLGDGFEARRTIETPRSEMSGAVPREVGY